MKIKTKYYGIFVKSNGKWSKQPSLDELTTKEDIIYNSELGLEDEISPDKFSFKEHKEAYLKRVRKFKKKPVKLLRQVWIAD